MSKFKIKIDIIIFLLALIPLIIAYISEYIFGLNPCNLCIYQRIPFFSILFLSLCSIFFIHNIKIKKYIFYLLILLFLGNMILGLYHVGIEQKLFDLPTSCSGLDLLNMSNIEQLTEMIMQKSAVKCDDPAFEIFGISMAMMNVIYCFIAIIIIFSIKNALLKFK
jgi:disulfide bond formation protein DsbB